MYAWEAIQQSINYIEDHIEEKLNNDRLAQVAGLSCFYYQRLFHRLVQKTPMEYLRLRRLAKACAYMQNHHEKIIDVAFRFGFENHETFTRSFKEQYGMTPEKYRNQPCIMNHCSKTDLSLDYIMMEDHVPLVCEDMVLEMYYKELKQERYFIGIEKEISIQELMGNGKGVSMGVNIWEEFHALKHKIPNLLRNGNEIGALYMGNASEGNCIYLAAAQVETIDEIPMNYSSFVLSPGKYLITSFEAETEEILYGDAVFKADRFANKWIAYHQVEMTAFGIEMYYREQTPPYLEHWGKVKQ